jgi:ATP-dependent DNA helicase RecG
MARVLFLDDVPEQLSEDSFWELLGRVEHQALDFKRGVPDDILTTIPAMAMTDGGLIVHGVAPDLTITGCPLSQNTQDRITRFANECDVEVRIRSVLVGESELTVTEVPEIRGRIVTTPDGRLLRRVGGDSQPLRGDALARFVRQREDHSGEDEPVKAFRSADVDLSVLNAVLEADGRPSVGQEGALRALVDLGVALPGAHPSDISVLRAAAVLFADDPGQYVRGASVQIVRREGVGPGPGPTSARTECSGPLSRILDDCLRFISRHTRQYAFVRGVKREILPEYPEPVLREAILNALAHRDYGLVGTTVDITIWDDRIEVRSPGPLPGHITTENMREEHYSRNRRLMRVLKVAGLVEEYGDGVDRMYREMEARLMEPPIFSSADSSVTVTLRNRFLVDVEDQVWLSLLGQYPMTMGERHALVIARREGSVTPRRLRHVLGDSDVGELLSGAVAKGLLVRVGERGGSRYELSDEIVLRAGSAGMEAQSRKGQLLYDTIQQRGSISTSEGMALLGESASTVRGLLNGLVGMGLARAEGRTRGRRYHRA